MPELALDDDQRHAFASHLDSVGVPKLVWREASADTRRGAGAGAPQLSACRSWRPVASARSAVDDAQQRTDREISAHVKPRLELLPSPCVHSDLTAAPTLSAPDQERATALIQITSGESTSLLYA